MLRRKAKRHHSNVFMDRGNASGERGDERRSVAVCSRSAVMSLGIAAKIAQVAGFRKGFAGKTEFIAVKYARR
jgi:hypothetical protein